MTPGSSVIITTDWFLSHLWVISRRDSVLSHLWSVFFPLYWWAFLRHVCVLRHVCGFRFCRRGKPMEVIAGVCFFLDGILHQPTLVFLRNLRTGSVPFGNTTWLGSWVCLFCTFVDLVVSLSTRLEPVWRSLSFHTLITTVYLSDSDNLIDSNKRHFHRFLNRCQLQFMNSLLFRFLYGTCRHG